MIRYFLIFGSVVLASCATTPMSERAAAIQMHSQYSTLLAKCQALGPLKVSAQGAGTLDEGFSAASIKLREAAAATGADTVVIVNSERIMFGLYNREQVIHGVALRCY